MSDVSTCQLYFPHQGRQDYNPNSVAYNSCSRNFSHTLQPNLFQNDDRSLYPKINSFFPHNGSTASHLPFQQSYRETAFTPPQNYPNSNGFPEEEADWFDFGDDDIQILDHQNPEQKFADFPVPAEPVVPFERLTVAIMDDYEFYCDDQDYVQVYTDGSYRNTFGDSHSAIGIWFGPNHKLNVSQPTYLGGFNSDGAELEAIIEAVKIACSCGVEKVQVNTDSQNSVRFLTYFISKWETNGWRNIRGLPVRNQNLIRQLDHYSQLVSIKWNYVPSDAGVRGNVEADLLARSASAACAGTEMRAKKRKTVFPIRVNRKKPRYSPY